MESRVAIACPECSELFHPNDIAAVVQSPPLMEKYQVQTFVVFLIDLGIDYKLKLITKLYLLMK